MVNRNSNSVRSVSRAIAVMKFLSVHGPSSLTEVANGVDIYKSTAHRLLTTLRDEGLVEQDGAASKYQLGFGLAVLASSVTADLDILRCARPVCELLSEQTRETVTISVLEADDVISIHQAISRFSAVNVDWTGKHTPIHATAAGKIFLAHMPEEQRCGMLERPLERFTEHTIVDPATLRDQLHSIRIKDYAYATEELEIGLNVVGAPIRFSEGPVTAAVTVSGPAFRFPEVSIHETGQLAKKAAAEVSRCLGFRG
jgi:DNA-binding IclR family transcriptional regulator